MDERNPGLMRIVILWEYARAGVAPKQDNYIALPRALVNPMAAPRAAAPTYPIEDDLFCGRSQACYTTGMMARVVLT